MSDWGIMTSFRMQERDLDLFILEELHSDNGFDCWFGERIGLKGFRCRGAEHSVSAKSNAKWGETDVLALYSDNVDIVAVLIEIRLPPILQNARQSVITNGALTLSVAEWRNAT